MGGIKTKESRVRRLLDENGIRYIWNAPINGRYSTYRTDFLIKRKDFYVVVEVDEQQHRSYQGEALRMARIYHELKKPVCFIRYNPDDYLDMNNEMRETPRQLRHQRLLQTIEELREVTAPLSVVYLYYDGDTGKNLFEEIRVHS